MEPKLKAEELFDKMLYNNGDEYHHCSHYVGKNCALIAVDEVMQKILWDKSEHRFWLEVKQELKNL